MNSWRPCQTVSGARRWFGSAAVLAIGLILLAGCGDPAAPSASDATTADTAQDTTAKADTVVNNWAHGYTLKLTFQGGKASGQSFQIDKDLDGTKGLLSFGNSHLTPPAVQFALQDHWQQEWSCAKGKCQSPMDFQINFGNLIGSAKEKEQTPQAGTYPFGCQAPSILVNFVDGFYTSTCPALDGLIVVTDWSAVAGGRFAGHFSGRLHEYYKNSSYLDDCNPAHTAVTCAEKQKRWVDVQGVFGFTIPPLNERTSP